MTSKKTITPQNTTLDANYNNLLQELQGILETGMNQAYKAVDNIKVQTYWQLGERIVREELKRKDRAEYGASLLKNLAIDLEIRERKLYEIVEFYRAYPILRSLTAKLSWTHYTRLILIKKAEEREFYEKQAEQHSWSVKKLREAISNDLYSSTSSEERKQVAQTKVPNAQALEVFRHEAQNYDLHFIENTMNQKEKDIENAIIQNIDVFLETLGEGFSFTGRQVPIKMDGKTHYIDLVLFHKGIPCTILVDLKNQAIDSRDIGQMNKYVSYWRKNCQYDYEKDAIGLVLCKEIHQEEVAYALEDLEEKIFVATYKTKLPSEEAIKKAAKLLD